MKNNEFLNVFLPHEAFSANVHLGSETYLNIPLNKVRSALYSNKKPKGKNYPDAPEPVTITEVDGVEIKVERLPMRYEKLDDIFEELPDFVQELLQDKLTPP
jgi:hypothetical protein